MVVDYDGDALFFILPPGLRERRCAKPVFILPPQLASLLAGQMPDRPSVVRLAKCFANDILIRDNEIALRRQHRLARPAALRAEVVGKTKLPVCVARVIVFCTGQVRQVLGHVHAAVVPLVALAVGVNRKLMPLVNDEERIETLVAAAAAPNVGARIDVVVLAGRMQKLGAVKRVFVEKSGDVVQVAVLFVVEKKCGERFARLNAIVQVDTFLDFLFQLAEQPHFGLHHWHTWFDAAFHKPSEAIIVGRLILRWHVAARWPAAQRHLLGCPKVLRIFVVLRHAIPKMGITAGRLHVVVAHVPRVGVDPGKIVPLPYAAVWPAANAAAVCELQATPTQRIDQFLFRLQPASRLRDVDQAV